MIYFDNSATTYPKPRVVVESVKQAIEFYGGNPGRGGHSFSMRVSEKIYMVRKKIADFFGDTIAANQVIFTSNCTMALNIAIKGCLKKGDHVIISCLEHNSVIRPVHKLEQIGIVSYDIAEVGDTDEETIKSFEQLIKPNTKAIVCTHASNVTGIILPITKLGAICKAKDITFIVDAAQTAGVIPINMDEMNIDILCTAGHKGLYGITGTGVLIVHSDILLDTLIEGGTGSASIELEQPDIYPDRLEAGTVNTAGIFSIGAGIDYINSIGISNLYAYEFSHCKKVFDILKKFTQVELALKNFVPLKNTPVIAFNIEGINSEIIVAKLNESGFALRGGLHCSPLAHKYYQTIDKGLVRFSPSIFTSEYHIELFLKTIIKLIKKTMI